MRQFGLIGFPLSHSFSKGYFANHFLTENILDAQYENYPIESIDSLTDLWKNNPALKGLKDRQENFAEYSKLFKVG